MAMSQPQEALLAMPYQFMVPILNQAPLESRPLRRTDAAKAQKYIQLAKVLLNRFPSDTSGRAVEFLMDLVQNQNPGSLCPLPFYTTAGSPDTVRISNSPALFRVAPAMVFQARLGR